MKRLLLTTGALNLCFSLSVLAQTNSTTIKQDSAAAKQEKSPFSSSFGFTIGSDNNALVVKEGITGSFYEIAPSFKYSGEIIRTSVSAKLKDFSDQAVSNNAKETSADITTGIDAKVLGGAESSTDLSVSYSDSRWPNLFASTPEATLYKEGMPVRYIQSKISQSLGWSIDRLNLKAAGSFAYRDYSSGYSDFAKDIFGATQFQNDQSIADASLRVGIKISDMVEVAATPSLALKKFSERPARETDGSKLGAAGDSTKTEFLSNSLKAEIKIDTGIVQIAPNVTSGVQMDQAHGGEDYSLTGAGIDLGVVINKARNIKLNGGIAFNKMAYDNWTYAMKAGEKKREDNDTTTTVSASMDLTKTVALNLGYQNIEEKSTLDDGYENYRQEIFSTGINLSF